MRRPRRNLAFKAAASMVTVVTLAVAIVSSLSISYLDKHFDQGDRHETETLLRLFAEDARQILSSGDVDLRERARETAAKYVSVGAHFAQIVAADDQILASAKVPGYWEGTGPAQTEESASTGVLGPDTTRVLHRRLEGMAGRVVLGLPVSRATAELSRIKSTVLSVSIGIILMAALVMVWLTQRWVRPLREMAIEARAIKRGNFDVSVPVRSGDEAGELALAFNQMAWALRTHRRTIEEQQKRLEEKVRARTFELAATRSYLEDLIANAADGIVTLTSQGEVKTWNQGAQAVLGLTTEQVCGKPFESFVKPADGVQRSCSLSEHLRGVDMIGHHVDGFEVKLEASFSPVLNEHGELHGSFVVFRDVTARRRAEAALRVAYERLREVDTLKDQFISNVSHELRTPLTSIRSFSEILLSCDPEQWSRDHATTKEFLTIINTESERLTRLINDVLDLAKIESGRVEWHLTVIDMAEIARLSTQTIRPMIDAHSLRVVVEFPAEPLTVRGDRDKLQQVFVNLLSNAAKFSPRNGQITIRGRSQGGVQLVEVIDQGPGIPDSERENVFKRFKQIGDTLREKPEGTGLGLPICRGIVEYLGGRIWVERAPGGGSRFAFSLPACDVTRSEVDVTPEATSREPSSRGTVLVVDDDPNIRRALAYTLGSEGYRVVEAGDGHEGLERLAADAPDLILLDIMMPRMGGLEFLAALRDDASKRHIPVIVLSAFPYVAEAGLRLGASEFLAKPAGTKAVCQVVRRYLGEGSLEGRLLVLRSEGQKDDLAPDFRAEGYQVRSATLSTGMAIVREFRPDLVILDMLSADPDALEFARALESAPETESVPVLFYAGDASGRDAAAIALGAADYVARSQGFQRLRHVVHCLLKRGMALAGDEGA